MEDKIKKIVIKILDFKFSKKKLILMLGASLLLTILISFPVSELTHNYLYLMFAIGIAIEIPVIAL